MSNFFSEITKVVPRWCSVLYQDDYAIIQANPDKASMTDPYRWADAHSGLFAYQVYQNESLEDIGIIAMPIGGDS